MKINAYCLDWHVANSAAFVDLLVDPLEPYIGINLKVWDGERIPKETEKKTPLIFCMLPPSETVLKNYKGKIVWIPMWDQAQGYDKKWWNNLPTNLSIVAFSDVVCQKATQAGLKTLRLKYYKNPKSFKPVSWERGNIVFYWNRTGLIDQTFLEKLCSSIGATELLFRSHLDPRIDKKFYYQMLEKIGNTEVVDINVDSRGSYLRAIEPANIFIAPRAREGVGMTFLEAMARGCAVIANNESTMNEYIFQNKNGLLLDYPESHRASKLTEFISTKRSEVKPPIHHLSRENQDWQEIAKINFRRLGDKARLDSQKGYERWIKSIPKYAEFILSDRP